jgi:hypothetical protein
MSFVKPSIKVMTLHVLVTTFLCACSDMTLYEGLRTQQQKTRDTNRSSPGPLPMYDQFKKERDAMRPAGE